MTSAASGAMTGPDARPRVGSPVVAALLAATCLVHAADPVDARAAARSGQAAELALAIDDARFLLASGQARAAAERLHGALAAAERVDAALRERATVLLAQTRQAADAAETAGDESARSSTAADARATADGRAGDAGSLRAERLARIRDLRDREHLDLALSHCRTLLRDLPGDEEVDGEFRDLLERAHRARRADVEERERDLREEIALLVERSLIPEGVDGRPVWPSDWNSRRAGRRSGLESGEAVPEWMDAVRDRLAQRISLVFDAVPVADAVVQIAQLSGINIVVAPELQAATDRKVTLRAVNMRVEDVLAWIAEQGGTRWSITRGAAFVGDAVDTDRTIALHDVAGLIVGTVDQPGPRMDFGQSGGGGGATLLAAEPAAANAATPDDIAELIRTAVSPATWTQEGNAMVVRGSTLLVTAPPDVQRLIREFIRAQEQQRSLAVRIDARWLEMTDRFVEEIGVEWSSGAGTMVAPPPGQPSAGLLRQTPGWSVAANSTNQLPGTAMTLVPATTGSGLTLQSAFFGDTRLNAILHAVERNAQGRVLQAPEVTCLNGQQAHAVFCTQLAYISDYQVVGGTPDPVIAVLNLGTVIEVRPMVSSDRRYVTLDLRSSVSSATLFTDYFGASVAVPGRQINPNGPTPLPLDATTVFTSAYPIELPNVAIQSASTTVMVPDRGSMLVGGFSRSLDQFSSTRVPLLGSIPFLGRLFGARGRYADRTKLYLLSTVTVINYPELEARL